MTKKRHLHAIKPSDNSYERYERVVTDRELDFAGTYPGSLDSDFIQRAGGDSAEESSRRHPSSHNPRTTTKQWRDYFQEIEPGTAEDPYIKASADLVREVMEGVDKFRKTPQEPTNDQPRVQIGARANRDYWNR